MCLGEYSPSDPACLSGICSYCNVDMKERVYFHSKECPFYRITLKFYGESNEVKQGGV